MLREAQLDHLEHLVDAYSAVKVYWGKVEDLERQIEQSFVEQASQQATFDAIQSIVGRVLSNQSTLPSRVAWTLQHVLNCRAYCVKNRIVHTRDENGSTRFESPLLDQIRMGRDVNEGIDLQFVFDERDRIKAKKTIDSLLIDSNNRIAYVVAVVSLDHSRKLNKYLKSRGATSSLFQPEPREVLGAHVDSARVCGVLLARELLEAALPNFFVRPIVVVADNDDYARGFQAHCLADFKGYPAPKSHVALDDYPLLASSRNWCEQGNDIDDLDFVPNWSARDQLHCLPIDRASRSCMVLNKAWEMQAKHPNALVAKTWNELGAVVEECYAFAYLKDARRHDVEDCLERNGYLSRLTYDSTRFAITPRGVARTLLMRRLLAPLSGADHDNGISVDILSHLFKQATLWSKYREGDVEIR